ncbi:MAG: hypothetical protein OEY22_09475 [Candidatus Bathyarchaeota archaeon]|nr:hypothetical protein [Candidatus Bathyarchaeota archaeon]MDH5788463.1 hypothetical protein [Candidatus Bathyarchaeota archaeon]
MKILIIPILIGAFLIGLVYASYFYVLSPFYHLDSLTDSRLISFSLNSTEQKCVYICPAYEQHPYIFLSEDLTFDLNLSIVSNPGNLSVYVYAGGVEMLRKEGTNFSEVINQRSPLNFPSFPGEWLSKREPPLYGGAVLCMEINNLSQENTNVDVDYSVVSYYRLGAPINLVIVIIGFAIIGVTLLILLLHSINLSITTLTKKTMQHKAKKESSIKLQITTSELS